jgi:hypothetical protein
MKRFVGAALAFSLLSAPAIASKPTPAVQDPSPQERIEKAERPVLDVVFVLDTSPPRRCAWAWWPTATRATRM